MGRNALILSIRCENLELIDLLLSKMSFGSIEDALLYAVSLEKTHIVKYVDSVLNNPELHPFTSLLMLIVVEFVRS